MVSAFLVVAALIGSPPAGCSATVVRYQPAKHPTLGESPWVLARPQGPGILGFLPTYPSALRDGRVNRFDGLVLWQRGAKIVWNTSGTLTARRLDGGRSIRIELVSSPDGAVSEPRFPSPGCWRLTYRANAGTAAVVARVIPRPTALRCEPTRVTTTDDAVARPHSSGIRGGWGPWRTPSGGVSIYTHGHGGGLNMKVPWWVRQGWGRSLELVGTRLDRDGTFKQDFPMALSPEGVFPSIVDVPAAGCWLFRLRTGQLAGVLVVRALDDRG